MAGGKTKRRKQKKEDKAKSSLFLLFWRPRWLHQVVAGCKVHELPDKSIVGQDVRASDVAVLHRTEQGLLARERRDKSEKRWSKLVFGGNV